MTVEQRIKIAIATLTEGPIPDGYKCDVTSLCSLAAVPRSTLYRSYPHLKAEFDDIRGQLRAAGQQPDPREARIERLKLEVEELRRRLHTKQQEVEALNDFRRTALSRITAQHDEILRLRREVNPPGSQLRSLPSPPTVS